MKIYMTFEANWGSNPAVEKIFAKKEDAIQYLIKKYKECGVFGYDEAELRKQAKKCLEERDVEGA